MVVISSVLLTPHVNFGTFSEPATVRVCNKEEEATFFAVRNYVLDGCKVWWEDNDDVTSELPELSYPNHPCTIIYPYYLDLGLKFPLSTLWKENLIFFRISICNLTSSSVCIVSCFECLNDCYKAKMGLPDFLILYTLRRSTDTSYFFQSLSNLWWFAYIT